MTTLKNHECFINELVSAFPEIKDEVLDEDYLGLISLQIGCFKRFTQKAIDIDDLVTVKKCFEFVNRKFETVEFEIENALLISYLGKLNITKNSEVEKLLSTKLKGAIERLTFYYESNPKNEKRDKFLNDLKDNPSSF
jgi:hypothetical protein